MESNGTPPPNGSKAPVPNGNEEVQADGKQPLAQQVRDMLQNLAREQLISLIVKLSTESPHVLEAVRDAAEKDPLKTKLFVRELAWETTSSKLREVFSQYGDIVEAAVVTDRRTGKSRGYGFVTFKLASSAQAALEQPNKEIDGRVTQANLASIGNPYKSRSFVRDMRDALPQVGSAGDIRGGLHRDPRDDVSRAAPAEGRDWRDIPLQHAIRGGWNNQQDAWPAQLTRGASPPPLGYPDYGLTGMHSPGRFNDYPRGGPAPGGYPAAYSPRNSLPPIQTGVQFSQPNVNSYSPPGPTGIAYPSGASQFPQPGSPLPYPAYSASPNYGPSASYGGGYPY